MISQQEFEELKKRYGLHHRAHMTDLPVKVLVERFTADELTAWCARRYFGNHFDALRKLDIDKFREVDHGQWDITLSHMAGKRVCGLPTESGECPYPFENNAEFWIKERVDYYL